MRGPESKQEAAFTLIELMVVIAIVGIMAATAFPLYGTYRQKVYGSEALVMTKQILDAQIMYFLEKNKFFPEDGQPIDIHSNDPPSKAEILEIKNALNVAIPVGHFLDYRILAIPGSADQSCMVMVWAPFPLFKGNSNQIVGVVDRKGEISIGAFP